MEKSAKDQADGSAAAQARSPQPSALPSHASSRHNIRNIEGQNFNYLNLFQGFCVILHTKMNLL
jgi:hypothetical protein